MARVTTIKVEEPMTLELADLRVVTPRDDGVPV